MWGERVQYSSHQRTGASLTRGASGGRLGSSCSRLIYLTCTRTQKPLWFGFRTERLKPPAPARRRRAAHKWSHFQIGAVIYGRFLFSLFFFSLFPLRWHENERTSKRPVTFPCIVKTWLGWFRMNGRRARHPEGLHTDVLSTGRTHEVNANSPI